MKINEITNAEDMLALWKLISDNTWSAIQQQAAQQAREKAERAAKTKSTKGANRGSGRRATPIVVSKPLAAAVKPENPNQSIANKPQVNLSQQAQQMSQPKTAYGATGVQPTIPAANSPIAATATLPSLPPTALVQPKPKLTARAGGLTNEQ
jgi:hypothetical protein